MMMKLRVDPAFCAASLREDWLKDGERESERAMGWGWQRGWHWPGQHVKRITARLCSAWNKILLAHPGCATRGRLTTGQPSDTDWRSAFSPTPPESRPSETSSRLMIGQFEPRSLPGCSSADIHPRFLGQVNQGKKQSTRQAIKKSSQVFKPVRRLICTPITTPTVTDRRDQVNSSHSSYVGCAEVMMWLTQQNSK